MDDLFRWVIYIFNQLLIICLVGSELSEGL